MFRSLHGSVTHRALVTSLGLALAVATATAQEVSVAPLLKSGDEFGLEVTRVRENSARSGQSGKSTTAVDVRVVEAGTTGFVLLWIPGESRIEGGPAADDPLVRASAEALRGLQLRLTLDADGAYTGLANQREVAAQLQAAVDPMVRALQEKIPAEQRAGFEKLLAQVLSPAVLVGSVTRDAQAYFNLNGVSLAVGETAAVDIEQPNPLGGGVLPAKFRVTLESATGDAAVLTTSTTYDPAAFVRATRALIEQSGKTVPDSELAALSAVQLSDDGRFVFDRKIGLMRELVVNRRVTAGKDQRLDRLEIRLVRAPGR